MRFDVALVHGRRDVGAFDNHVRVGEALGDITALKFDATCDVGFLGRFRLVRQAGGQCAWLDDGCISGHSGIQVQHRREQFVFHHDRVKTCFGRGQRRRRHCGNRMAVIGNSAARHDVAGEVREITRAFAADDGFRCNAGKILTSNHRKHTRHEQRLAGIDALYVRVGMGTAEDAAEQHTRQGKVRAEAGATGDLIDPIRPDGARTDVFVVMSFSHLHAPRISAAASSTARMILS